MSMIGHGDILGWWLLRKQEQQYRRCVEAQKRHYQWKRIEERARQKFGDRFVRVTFKGQPVYLGPSNIPKVGRKDRARD